MSSLPSCSFKASSPPARRPAPLGPAPPAPVPFTPPVPAKNPAVEAAAPAGSGMWTVTVVLPDDPSPKQVQEFGRDNPAIIAPLTDLGVESFAVVRASDFVVSTPGWKVLLKEAGPPPAAFVIGPGGKLRGSGKVESAADVVKIATAARSR